MDDYEGVFDPDLQCTYADRVRRRQPGDKTLGLSPHMDAGTVERWIDPGYQRVYASVFAGDWRGYDPFDGTHRLETREIPSPAVCERLPHLPGLDGADPAGAEGRHAPRSSRSPRASPTCCCARSQDDVPEDELCGAAPGRALGVSPEWHADLIAGRSRSPR